MRQALFTLLALLVPAAAAAGGERPAVRTLDARFACAGVELVELEFPVGQVIVAAHDGRDLVVKVDLACETRRSRSCQEAAHQVRLVGKVSDERLRVELAHWPRVSGRGLEARAKVQVPRFLALRCDLGVGELKVSGMERDVAIDLGVGEVHVSMPEHAVGRVDLDVGVGEADLSTSHGKQAGKGFIAKELHWRKGKGEAAIKVDCGVGEINVALVGKPPL
ncbi:MAG TPA: hypothetical protein VGC93_07040 [Thermoanaerobaculia bacterium]